MEENTEKKFLGMDAVMAGVIVGVIGLFLTILSVVIVLAVFAFNTIRADNARIEASIAASQASQKADVDKLEASIEGLRAEQKADSAALRAEQKAAIDALRAEQKADIEALRAEQRADIDMLSDKVDSLDAKIDALDDNLDTRLDEIEREQARTQGAIDVLRARQAPNP